MCNIFFTSDLHFGHSVISPKYRTQFDSAEEHDDYWFELMSHLSGRDVLYILGDFVFDCSKYNWYMEQIAKFPFRIKLVMGNHDSTQLYESTRPKNIELQQPFFTYKKLWLSHCPIHPGEIRGRVANVHGHLHNERIDNPLYFSVCPEQHHFKFVPFDKIKEHYHLW